MTERGRPRVSVVMGVHNDVRRIGFSVAAILTQSFRDLELIVVDDGSSDGSGAVLERLAAADSRLRVLRQENAGLTRALIRGCSEARGEFIARQDSDDWSHPLRISEQLELIGSDGRIGFVSCATQFIGPAGEPLSVLARSTNPQEATRGLLEHREGPPAHGSVMFRKSLYDHVGGYRPQFLYSQDSDLWLRMAEQAWIAYVPAVRYVHRRDIQCTSGLRRPAQRQFGQISHRCRQARLAGQDEYPILAEAEALAASLRESPVSVPGGTSAAFADAAYLLGAQLVGNRNARARRYLLQAIRHRPWHWKAWVRLVQSLLTGRSVPLLDLGRLT